jgi:hypothetical protein
MPNLETLRPSIRDQDYLDRLYEMGIFEKKLDVWAYCAAYALGKGLAPAPNSGSQMGSDLVHLDREMLDTLSVALQSQSESRLEAEELVKQLSGYASAGIADLRSQTEGKSRAQVLEYVLGQLA